MLQSSLETQIVRRELHPKAPAVLIATTNRWYATARLAMALNDAGFVVDAVCPSGHPFRMTRSLRQMHPYNGLVPLRSFASAIRKTKPAFVIPGDDLAIEHLHDLYRQERQSSAWDVEVTNLIERSLGPAGSFPIVRARNDFMQLAREEGIRVPESAVIENKSDLLNWIAQSGFPTVLKANGTSGGEGVKVVSTLNEAEAAFHKLQAPPLLARAAKHAVLDGDFTLVWPSLKRHRATVNAQAFVNGHEATSALFCWEGTVLAGNHFEVIQKVHTTGHATVMRSIEHREMTSAAEKIARRLNLSGFHGLDFMIEAETGNAYLIEINARTTQVGHLAMGPGRNLPAALHAAVTGQNIQSGPKTTEKDTIALFPHEWKRDPQSPFLSSAYHDVPWSEPEMVKSCISALHTNGSHPKSATKTVVCPAPLIHPAAKSQAAGWIAEQE